MLFAFAIPICFVILVGFVSYKKTESELVTIYSETTQNALNQTEEYLDYIFSMVESEGTQILVNDDTLEYIKGFNGKDISEQNRIQSAVKTMIMSKDTSSDFINAIHLIVTEEQPLITSSSVISKGFYSEIEKEVIGKKSWVGEHILIDKKLNSSTHNYALSYIQKSVTGRAYIVIDIDLSEFKNVFQNLNLSEDENIFALMEDGRKISVKSDSNLTLEKVDTLFDNKEKNQNQYVKIDNEEYLFLSTSSDVNQMKLYMLVPKSKVMSGAVEMKSLTITMIITCCFLAAGLAFIISATISASVKRISKNLKQAADGDLTIGKVSFKIQEFHILSGNLSKMLENTKNLICEVRDSSEVVLDSVKSLESVSQEVEEFSQFINQNMSEIGDGVVCQTQESQNGVFLMAQLAKQIEKVNSNCKEIRGLSEDAEMKVSGGSMTMGEMQNSVEDTFHLVENATIQSKELLERVSNIGHFTELINSLADSTNLLALNATIEAARAGSHGKGFAVVADEIKKLSNETTIASQEIEEITNEIGNSIFLVTSAMEHINENITLQKEKTFDTQMAFEEIENSINKISECLLEIISQIKEMSESKDNTMESVKNISLISEKTNLCSERVCNRLENQKEVVESMNENMFLLIKNMGNLEELIKRFKVSAQ